MSSHDLARDGDGNPGTIAYEARKQYEALRDADDEQARD